MPAVRHESCTVPVAVSLPPVWQVAFLVASARPEVDLPDLHGAVRLGLDGVVGLSPLPHLAEWRTPRNACHR